MKNKFYDLNIRSGKDNQEKIKTAEKLGWSGICLVKSSEDKYKDFAQEISKLKKDS